MRILIKKVRRKLWRRFRSATAGMTLTEILIATTIMGIVFIGFMGAFGNVAKAIQSSKSRSLASNLAQEQMQVLKQQSYYKILVTTSTAYNTSFTPNIPYDNGYHPPETLVEGGITFERLTYVQMAQDVNGTLTYLGATPDTGMKAITVTVLWTLGGERRKLQIRSIATNPDTVMSISGLTGRVKINGTGTGIPNATVLVADNQSWKDVTSSTGAYFISLLPGNHIAVAAARGYFTSFLTVPVGANQTVNQDFDLVAMAAGTVRGTVWKNDHLVITQVVGGTVSASGFDQEWVEIYNPTTWTWTASDVGVLFEREVDAAPQEIAIVYNTATIDPGEFYLFANTTTISTVGGNYAADAVWEQAPGGPNEINLNAIVHAPPRFVPVTDPNAITTYDDDNDWGAAGTRIYNKANNQTLDTVAWEGNGNGSAPDVLLEGSPMNYNNGLDDAEQFYRFSSTSGFNPAYGPAYDSGDSERDFEVMNPVGWVPHNSLSAVVPIIAGTPAVGAIVTCPDGFSQSTAAVSVGNPPHAAFTLTSVATGTYTVYFASGSYSGKIGNVTMTSGATVSIPNDTTSPVWPAANYNVVMLSTPATHGYVSGWVRNSAGLAISAPSAITVTNGTVNTTASTVNGNYFLQVSTGTFDIIANPNNGNSSYVSQSSQAVAVGLGQVVSNVNFVLGQGGKIQGKVSRDGINAIPGMLVIATDQYGVVRAQEVSQANGLFTMSNLSTGTYFVEPVLGSSEKSTPASVSTGVVAGVTVSVGTFTVTGAFGTITGKATLSGVPIQTGILVLASTSTITSPPALSSNTLTGAAFYITSTDEKGNYDLDVRGSTSTTYRLHAYYTTFSGSTPSISSRTLTGVSVAPGAVVSNQNFTW